MPEDHFGEPVAERYDESAADMFDPAIVDPAVDFLAALAGRGAALELGIGTGGSRCRWRGEASRCRASTFRRPWSPGCGRNPGATRSAVTIGDFATTRVDGAFSLAYLVFNTILNLTTQDEQVACFQNVAAHLEPGGCFVIEVGVPDLQRLPPGETVRPFTVSPTRLGFDEYDIASQGLISHHYTVVDGGLEVPLGAVSLRLAGGARPDGANRRDAAPRALGRLDARPVYERQHEARVGLGEAAGR